MTVTGGPLTREPPLPARPVGDLAPVALRPVLDALGADVFVLIVGSGEVKPFDGRFD